MTSVSQVFVVSLPFLDKLFYILQCVFFKQFQPNKIFKILKKKNSRNILYQNKTKPKKETNLIKHTLKCIYITNMRWT